MKIHSQGFCSWRFCSLWLGGWEIKQVWSGKGVIWYVTKSTYSKHFCCSQIHKWTYLSGSDQSCTRGHPECWHWSTVYKRLIGSTRARMGKTVLKYWDHFLIITQTSYKVEVVKSSAENCRQKILYCGLNVYQKTSLPIDFVKLWYVF